jgi:hypothetical protein
MKNEHWVFMKDLFLIAGTAVLATLLVTVARQLLMAQTTAPLADAALWWLGALVGFPASVAVHGLLGWLIAAVVARRWRRQRQ